MNRNFVNTKGIQLLMEKYKAMFRIPENLDYYSEKDFLIAEKKFIKYSIFGI
jgi:hypothetical protein